MIWRSGYGEIDNAPPPPRIRTCSSAARIWRCAVSCTGSSVTATRTVVLAFDRAGEAKIVKSTIEYKTETD